MRRYLISSTASSTSPLLSRTSIRSNPLHRPFRQRPCARHPRPDGRQNYQNLKEEMEVICELNQELLRANRDASKVRSTRDD
jgi:hypothetical protein